MDKGDPGPHAPGPGRLIHHSHPAPAQVRHRLVDVGDLHGDVMQCRSSPVNEPGDRPRSRRLKQLEIGVPGRKHTLNEPRGVLLVHAREPEQVADYLWRAVSRVCEGNMVNTGHLPGSAHFPQRFSRAHRAGCDLMLRDIIFYM